MNRYTGKEISIPYAEMIKLRQSGKLNLGIVEDIAVKIADNKDLAPTSKKTALALHF